MNCTKLELHNNCIHHLTAMSKWSAYKLMQKNGSVHNQIVSSSMQQIKENRTYMMQLIDITLFLSKQGIAFRGHRENEISINRGLFF